MEESYFLDSSSDMSFSWASLSDGFELDDLDMISDAYDDEDRELLDNFLFHHLVEMLEMKDFEQAKIAALKYPFLLSRRTDHDETPLHRALDLGADLDLVKTLTAPNVKNVRDLDGMTPLHIACSNAEIPEATVDYLMAQSVESLAIADNFGRLPLHCACECWSPARNPERLIHKLIDNYPQGLKEITADGETPLYLAVISGLNLELVHRMIIEWPFALLGPVAHPDDYPRLPMDFLPSPRANHLAPIVFETTQNLFVAFTEIVLNDTSCVSAALKQQVLETLVSSYPDTLGGLRHLGDFGIAQLLYTVPCKSEVIKSVLSANDLQVALKTDNAFQDLVLGFCRMNRAGRLMEKDLHTNKDATLRILEAVNDHVDSTFLFLRDRPHLFKS